MLTPFQIQIASMTCRIIGIDTVLVKFITFFCGAGGSFGFCRQESKSLFLLTFSLYGNSDQNP
jgi:hypothetical protein